VYPRNIFGPNREGTAREYSSSNYMSCEALYFIFYRCLHPVAYVTIKSVYSTVNATFIPIFVFIYMTCFDHIGSSSGVLTLVLKMHSVT
jgi:hypothetical protein